ncbi:MAG TPA: divalent-cation tolerance protein CutA [Candidatus Limnocylindria bacterium]|nr:divalent-cation tolerance protein CutA [Candidatus Limnocylindria bacterium]
MAAVVALVTCPAGAAERVAEAIVGARAAACASVVPGLRSVYWWRGALERADESLVVLKTVRDALPEVERILREVHPYETFELVAVDVSDGSAAYLAWIAAETRPAPG